MNLKSMQLTIPSRHNVAMTAEHGSEAGSGWSAFNNTVSRIQAILAVLVTIPAVFGPLTPVLAPRVLPRMFPTTDEVQLQTELELPLLRSAFDLQSRLYSIASTGYLTRVLSAPEPVDVDAAIAGTLYSFARFIALSQRALTHPDGDLGISTSGWFPYRSTYRRQRVHALLQSALASMGHRGSSRCSQNDLADVLSFDQGAMLTVISDAEQADLLSIPCSLGGCEEPPGFAISECGDVIVTFSGMNMSLTTLNSSDSEDRLREYWRAVDRAAQTGKPLRQRQQQQPQQAGVFVGDEDFDPSDDEEEDSVGSRRRLHPRRCDSMLMLRSSQRQAIAEVMTLPPPATSRRAGQLPVAPVVPFHVFADLLYPLLKPLYTRPRLLGTAVRARAALHAASIAHARERNQKRAQGTTTIEPRSFLDSLGIADGVRSLEGGDLMAEVIPGSTSTAPPSPLTPSPPPARQQHPQQRAAGPTLPSIGRAKLAAHRATCLLLHQVQNSAGQAVRQVTGGVAGLESATDVSSARRRATLVHWMGPLAADLIRLIDPQVMCRQRERLVRVQNAVLDLAQVLDAGHKLYTSSDSANPALQPDTEQDSWSIGSMLFRLVSVPRLLADWLGQAIGLWGEDASISPGAGRKAPSFEMWVEWFVGAHEERALDEEELSFVASWSPSRHRALHPEEFRACKELDVDAEVRAAERRRSQGQAHDSLVARGSSSSKKPRRGEWIFG
jgi:hypothetical protein